MPLVQLRTVEEGAIWFEVEDDTGIVSLDLIADGRRVLSHTWPAPVTEGLLRPDLAPGPHALRVVVHDWAGHSASAARDIHVPDALPRTDAEANTTGTSRAVGDEDLLVSLREEAPPASGPSAQRIGPAVDLSGPAVVQAREGSEITVLSGAVVVQGDHGSLAILDPAVAIRAGSDRVLIHPGSRTAAVWAGPNTPLDRILTGMPEGRLSVLGVGGSLWTAPGVDLQRTADALVVDLPAGSYPVIVLPVDTTLDVPLVDQVTVLVNDEVLPALPLDEVLAAQGPGHALIEQDGTGFVVMSLPGHGTWKVQALEGIAQVEAFLTPLTFLLATAAVAAGGWLMFRPTTKE